MSPESGREPSSYESAELITFFNPDRPVEGTVFVLPELDVPSGTAASEA